MNLKTIPVSLALGISCAAFASDASAAARMLDLTGMHPPRAAVQDLTGMHPPRASVQDLTGMHPPRASVQDLTGMHPPRAL